MYAIILVSPGNPVEVKTYPSDIAAYRAFGRIGLDKWTTEAHIVSLGIHSQVEQIKFYEEGSNGGERTQVLIENSAAAIV